jgi:hypothetical protein
VSDDRSPIDQALDLLFYAPIGLALNAEELVGQMAVRGRQSVAAAKFIGQMAVHQGRTEVDKALDRIQDQAAAVVEQLGHMSGARPGSTRAPSEAPVALVEPDGAVEPVDAADVPTDRSVAATGAAEVDVDVDVVAGEPIADIPVAKVNRSIPDYDSLAASQVVPRLGGLTDEELESVRAYESAHRSRTTILSRIAQLQRA